MARNAYGRHLVGTGTTMIYVTHDQTEAMTTGDRIAVFAPRGPGIDRNLMQIGTSDEMYARPANTFVARFLGTPKMNIHEVHATDGRILIGDSVFASGVLPPLPGTVLVGARPEDIRIDSAGAGARGAGRLRQGDHLRILAFHEHAILLCARATSLRPVRRIAGRSARVSGAAMPPNGRFAG